MRTLRFYVPNILSENKQITIQDDIHHHISRVLRLKVDDLITLFNGDAYDYSAKIISISKKETIVEILEKIILNNESPIFISAYLAILKSDAYEKSIQKAVELGVNKIIPLKTEHCARIYKIEQLEKKMEHWRSIIIASAMQSGRAIIPELTPVIDFSEALLDKSELRFIYSPHHQNQEIATSKNNLAVMIGPEGGFSDLEIEQALLHNWKIKNLGPRILRADTAATVAIAQMQALYGDL